MATIHAPDDVRELATPILKIFKASPDLKMIVGKQPFTSAQLEALEKALEDADQAVEDKRSELVPLLNARNALAKNLHDVLVQARQAIAGYFGKDSDEYELAGGTRTSERRRSGPRAPRSGAAAKTLPTAAS